MSHEINVATLGADGDNTTNDDHFLAAQHEARAGRRNPPAGAGNDWLGTKTITVPAGDYRITELRGLLGQENQSIKIAGLRFKGAGSNLTHIIFDPAVDGPLVFNDYWLNVAFEGFTFRTMRPGAVFLQSHTTNAAQKYTFTDVNWSGPWGQVMDLQGDNNNSEWSFYSCSTSGIQDTGAFLHIGATNTSDQFVNYWFYGFKHWSTGAPLIDAARGGHFHIFGLDVSDFGPNLTAPGYVFRLRGGSHANGVQNLTARAVRVEAKSDHAGLIHSEWGDGNVNIECDWSSQESWQTYGDIIRIDLGNTKGPIYNFHDSNLAGGVKVSYASDTWRQAPAIRFTNCGWHQRLTPSEVVTYARPSINAVDPAVEFTGCRGTTSNPYDMVGASVWDATVGHGALVHPRSKRRLSVRAVSGNLSGSSRLRVNLPVGAMITGLVAVAPGATTGMWEAWTSEVEPRLVASSSGGSPFVCATRGQATLSLRATNDDPSPTLLMLEGYW